MVIGPGQGEQRRFAYPRMAQESVFYLPEFDTKPANLDLIVGAPDELQVPLGAPADQIAGAVQPLAGRGRIGMRHEALGRQTRASPVAARQPDAADVQLAYHSDWQQSH